MISHWVSTTVLALSLLGQAGAQDEPTVATIQQSISELAHSSFRVRQDAMKRLWAMGDAAEAELTAALKSPDREVRSRAAWALDRIRLGIGPDSPVEVLVAFERFRNGNLTQKQVVLQELAKASKFRVLFRFINSIEETALREQLSRPFWSQFDRLASSLLEDENFTEYEETLKWGIKTDTSTRGASYRVRQLVVFWHLRGQLDDQLAAVMKSAKEGINRQDQHIVAYAHYLKEDFNEALVWAEKAGEAGLASDIHLRQRNWKKLLEQGNIGRDGIESLGFKAAFYRQLGDSENLNKTLSEIEKMADDSSSQRWFCGEALLVNGEPERAIELFKKSKPPTIAFQLLCYQGRFKEAFKLVKLDNLDDPTTWYQKLLSEFKEVADQRKQVHPIAIEVGRRLYNLNQTEAAEKLFDAIATTVSNKENVNELRSLAKMELTVGLVKRALDHGAKAIELEPERTNSVIWSLHPKDYQTAWSWWRFNEDQNKQASHRERLQHLRDLFYPEDEAAAKKQLSEKAAAALKFVERQPNDQQGPMLKAIADLCKKFDDVGLTEKYLLLLGEKHLDAKVWMELGNLYGEHERWREAAEMYRLAWDADKLKPGALYLEGHALSKLGADKKAQKLMMLAKMVPLANAENRRGLATDLDAAGLTDHAIEQWHAITRFGSPPALTGEFAWTVSYANRQIGNAISDEEPAAAAERWERWLIYLLRTQSSFTEPHHYLSIPHLIEKNRAKGFIKEGKFEEAIAAIQKSRVYVPLEVNLPIEVVPLLDEAGQHDAADKLFQDTYDVHKKVLANFPNSALHLNNAAWLAANCNRHLDEALEYALKATKIAPDRASYVDTLGEVYFRKGDRENAIKNAKRCIELDPTNDFYPKQRTRFEEDPIPNSKATN